ncbi:hypothetical protein HOE04_00550 [archaeon]|jgi:hypothetical protein|nr:hypothetical protein [archaeon]
MKKLLTKKQQQKKDRRNQLIVGILLIALMLFSTLGYALGGKSTEDAKNKVDYKDITFTKTSGYWSFNYQGTTFNTLYNPTELQDIPVLTQSTLQSFSQKTLYFVGEFGESASEIARNLNPFVLRINNACLPNTNCTTDSPTKNISTDNIIVFQEPTENQQENIYQQEKAIFITASYTNQTKLADALLFKILGI